MAYVVQDMHSIPNAESYCFQSISAFSLYSFYWEGVGKPEVKNEAEILKEVPSMEGCFVPELSEFSKLQQEAKKFHSGDLYNTKRIIEGFVGCSTQIQMIYYYYYFIFFMCDDEFLNRFLP